MPTRRRPTLAALALAGAAVLGGCSGDEPAAGPTEAPATTAAPEPTVTAAPTETGAPTGTDAPTGTAAPTESPTDSAIGGLVEGFPTDIIPVLPDSEVTVSTVVPVDGRRQVTLAGRTMQPADAVLTFYRDALLAQGFTATATALPEGVAGSTFSRAEGAEILTLTVTSAGGDQQFTIGGFLAG